MKIEHCRSCGAEIVWMKTIHGRATPVNADTVKESDTVFNPKEHTTHFATCPNSKEWKRASEPPKPVPALTEAKAREIVCDEIKKQCYPGGLIAKAMEKWFNVNQRAGGHFSDAKKEATPVRNNLREAYTPEQPDAR